LRFRRWILDESRTTPQGLTLRIEDVGSGAVWTMPWGGSVRSP